ncbi:Toluene efflux pump outer membrane protein TtgI precursor [Vibrio mediterranei]|uniref:efflux transporter outer membrane subunit n=1 Tax=Vibrio mediterranei TaxID=689 RepID=UPI0007816FE9|nr:efflux transporter outer membrane subunit [Vibrio mediterranei]MCG9661911.1 efflux transporter outer membrane subunit [Vibrio mediterranei]SBO09258.1 Toluene efflux pump outer membrane protein TtgI precursor [Vibrio mediterranei]
MKTHHSRKCLLKALKLAPLALAITLAGCAVGPDYTEPTTTLSNAYLHSSGTQLAEDDYWWTSFNDSSLNQMVQDVQRQNIPLKMAAERIKMANSYQSVVSSFKVPTVNIGAGYFNYQLSKNDSLLGPALNPIGDSLPTGTPLDSATLLDNQHDGVFAGASIAWEMDLFGRLDRQSNAAKIRVEQAEIYRSGLNTLITADLVHNYLQYRGAQERMTLVQANLVDQAKTLELVKKLVKSGYGSELDLAQAQTMLAATESVIPQLEIAQQVHKQRIATLLGEPLTKVDIRLASSANLPNLEGVIPVGLPSDLLTRRPDIRIAEREMAAINEEVAASIANRYPKFFLTGTPGVSASSFDDLFDSDSVGWAAAVGVNWNVFDGGRGEALVELNEARFDAAALGYEHAVNSAITEVDSMLFAYGRSQQNEQRIEKALTASENALGKAQSLYNAGLINHLALLDAQRQQRIMEDRLLAARLQTAQVTVSVFKSLGGDWQLPETDS